MSDDELIRLLERYYECEDAAFEAFHEAVFKRLVGLFRKQGLENSAEDLAQEVLVRVLQTKDGRGNPFTSEKRPSIWPWLRTIGIHVAVDERRRQARRPPRARGGDEPGPDAPDSGPNAEDLAAFNECLDKLPQEFREVFDLRRVQGYTTQETAARLGIKEGTVGSRLYRADALMRQCLAGE